MNESQAAMGICNLRHIDSEISKRKVINDLYCEKLGNIEGIGFQRFDEKIKRNYAFFPAAFKDYKYSRDEIRVRLKENNVIVIKYFSR